MGRNSRGLGCCIHCDCPSLGSGAAVLPPRKLCARLDSDGFVWLTPKSPPPAAGCCVDDPNSPPPVAGCCVDVPKSPPPAAGCDVAVDAPNRPPGFCAVDPKRPPDAGCCVVVDAPKRLLLGAGCCCVDVPKRLLVWGCVVVDEPKRPPGLLPKSDIITGASWEF